MELIDHVLDCLEHFKPLWDFLTAVGTVGAVVVALLLALRKPKVHLFPGARMQGTTIVLSATNKGSEPATVLGWEWRAACIEGGRVDLAAYPYSLNSLPGLSAPQRLVKSDLLVTWVSVNALAEVANPRISAGLQAPAIEQAVRSSRFACLTTTGEVFEANLPESAQAPLMQRLGELRA